MHTPKTARTLLPNNKASNNLAASFIGDTVSKWDDHKSDGKYIIGYVISEKLDSHSKKVIPEVIFDIHLTNV